MNFRLCRPVWPRGGFSRCFGGNGTDRLLGPCLTCMPRLPAPALPRLSQAAPSSPSRAESGSLGRMRRPPSRHRRLAALLHPVPPPGTTGSASSPPGPYSVEGPGSNASKVCFTCTTDAIGPPTGIAAVSIEARRRAKKKSCRVTLPCGKCSWFRHPRVVRLRNAQARAPY